MTSCHGCDWTGCWNAITHNRSGLSKEQAFITLGQVSYPKKIRVRTFIIFLNFDVHGNILKANSAKDSEHGQLRK